MVAWLAAGLTDALFIVVVVVVEVLAAHIVDVHEMAGSDRRNGYPDRHAEAHDLRPGLDHTERDLVALRYFFLGLQAVPGGIERHLAGADVAQRHADIVGGV